MDFPPREELPLLPPSRRQFLPNYLSISKEASVSYFPPAKQWGDRALPPFLPLSLTWRAGPFFSPLIRVPCCVDKQIPEPSSSSRRRRLFLFSLPSKWKANFPPPVIGVYRTVLARFPISSMGSRKVFFPPSSFFLPKDERQSSPSLLAESPSYPRF